VSNKVDLYNILFISKWRALLNRP